MITYNVNEQHSRKSTLELINNRQDRSLLYNFLFSLNIILLQVFTTFQPNLYYKMLNKCINYLSNDVCLLQYTNYVKKKWFVFSNLLSLVIIFIDMARVVCFMLQKCDVISGKGA